MTESERNSQTAVGNQRNRKKGRKKKSRDLNPQLRYHGMFLEREGKKKERRRGNVQMTTSLIHFTLSFTWYVDLEIYNGRYMLHIECY